MPTLVIYRGVIDSIIAQGIPPALYQALQARLSYQETVWSHKFDPKLRRVRMMPQILTRVLFGQNQVLNVNNWYPTGLENTVFEILAAQGYAWVIKPWNGTTLKIAHAVEPPTLHPSSEIELRYYQQEAIDVMTDKHRCIVELPTGTGKTIVIAGAIQQANRYPALVITHTKELLTQTHDVLERYLGCDIGTLGAGQKDIQAITVATAQTITSELKKPKLGISSYLADVQLLCIDETHHARATTIQALSRACINAKDRWGVSGTPFRDEGSGNDMEVQAYLGPLLYKKTLTEMVDQGFLVRPHVYLFDVHPNYIYDKSTQYAKVIEEYICNNPARDAIIAKLVKYLEDQGLTGLVLVAQKAHGQALSALIPDSEYISGDDTKVERERILDAINTRRTKSVVCTPILREGVDVPPATYLLHGHPYRSYVAYWQSNGRVYRPYPGKERAVVVDIWDHTKFLDKQGAARYKYLRREPCIKITRKTLNW